MNTKIKNLVKSAMLGVAVLGGAIALQSFGEKVTPSLDSTFYGWNESAEEYQKIGSTYNPNSCITGSQDCVVESETDMGDSISLEEAANLPRPGNHPNSQYNFN